MDQMLLRFFLCCKKTDQSQNGFAWAKINVRTSSRGRVLTNFSFKRNNNIKKKKIKSTIDFVKNGPINFFAYLDLFDCPCQTSSTFLHE